MRSSLSTDDAADGLSEGVWYRCRIDGRWAPAVEHLPLQCAAARCAPRLASVVRPPSSEAPSHPRASGSGSASDAPRPPLPAHGDGRDVCPAGFTDASFGRAPLGPDGPRAGRERATECVPCPKDRADADRDPANGCETLCGPGLVSTGTACVEWTPPDPRSLSERGALLETRLSCPDGRREFGGEACFAVCGAGYVAEAGPVARHLCAADDAEPGRASWTAATASRPCRPAPCELPRRLALGLRGDSNVVTAQGTRVDGACVAGASLESGQTCGVRCASDEGTFLNARAPQGRAFFACALGVLTPATLRCAGAEEARGGCAWANFPGEGLQGCSEDCRDGSCCEDGVSRSETQCAAAVRHAWTDLCAAGLCCSDGRSKSKSACAAVAHRWSDALCADGTCCSIAGAATRRECESLRHAWSPHCGGGACCGDGVSEDAASCATSRHRWCDTAECCRKRGGCCALGSQHADRASCEAAARRASRRGAGGTESGSGRGVAAVWCADGSCCTDGASTTREQCEADANVPLWRWDDDRCLSCCSDDVSVDRAECESAPGAWTEHSGCAGGACCSDGASATRSACEAARHAWRDRCALG
jgi:hypothetical protein